MTTNHMRLSIGFLPALMPACALLLACALSEGPQVGPNTALAGNKAGESLDPSDAATPWRWLGDKGDQDRADCPRARGWSVQPLFAQEDDSPIPRGLSRFCLYETKRGRPDALRRLVDQGDLAAVAPDHMAIGPSASELEAAVWEDLAGHFLIQAGDVDLPAVKGVSARLVFADTGPTNDTDPENGWTDNSPHGYTLVNMAKDLLCGKAGCLAQVTSRLALSHTDLSPNRHPFKGGFIGTLTEVAAAVRQEVHLWEASGAGAPLILNLSLGWDGGLFGGGEAIPGDMPLDVQAVHAAIENAVCRGALVVAAAGNLAGGPDPETGPLFPAAWEKRPAPSLDTCKSALLGTDPPDPGLWPAGYWPLVYAAGGVEASGSPLANARPGGEPRLTAFADHAVVDDSRPAPTAVLTGSSVSAAVVSVAAATVWYYRPDLKAPQVMELVYQGGEDLKREADFCLGGTPRKPCPFAGLAVRKASVCAAVAEACAAGGGACPASLPSCAAAGALDLSTADLSAFLASPPIAVDLGAATSSAAVPACGGETLHYSVRPPDPCPHRQYYGLTADLWSGPQPGSNPCSACYLNPDPDAGLAAAAGTATLYLEIDSEFVGTLTAATLIIGSETYSVDPAATLAAGDQAVVENVPAADSGTPILLAFTLNGSRSVLAPVLLAEN